MPSTNCYAEPWYLDVVCPHYRTYTDGQITFHYEINDRGEAASPYGYCGIQGCAPGSEAEAAHSIARSLRLPVFVRHSLGATPRPGPDVSARNTRVIPCRDPWPDGCDFRKEAARASRLQVAAEVHQPSSGALAAFKAGYLTAMETKHAGHKYTDLVTRLELWQDQPGVVVVSAHATGALFLVGSDGWAHYHLSYRLPESHNTAMYAIFAAAVPHLASLGCERIHLGGGMTASEDDPLYRFKAKVGRIPHTIYTQEVP